MKLKKFQAPSVREALIQIKEKLGADAVILRTEKLKSGKLGGSDLFEVTAALDETVTPPPVAEESSARELKTYSAQGSYRAPVKGLTEENSSGIPNVNGEIKNELLALRKEIHSLKGQLNTTMHSSLEVPAEFQEPLHELQEKGLKNSLVLDFVSDLIIECPTDKRTPAEISLKLQEVLSKKIPCKSFDPQDPKAKVILFIGPTGVGKSTTIAKLAADSLLDKGKRVGIVSTDAYRIGALEQMELFSRAAEIDFEAVFDVGDVERILERFKGYDLIFVDTAGRAKQHSQHMEELREIKEAFLPDEVHLTLSANTRDKDLEEIFNRFAPVGITQLLFTKVDETVEPGGMVNLAIGKGCPISYLCDGQNIPDDLMIASGQVLTPFFFKKP